jgi:hypothetical protein
MNLGSVYFDIVNKTSMDTLLQLPHLHKGIHPTGFIVRTNNAKPSFPFTVCPLFFIGLDETSLPGNNPHDVLVEWKAQENLESKLYTLYERYKDENLEETEDSRKRYLYDKKLPQKKVVIPTLHRKENLVCVLKRFQNINLPEEGYRPPILVIEHSPYPELKEIVEEYNVEWIWFYLDPTNPLYPVGQFNKALCYDKAFLFGSPAEWYLFHDNDILVPRDFWHRLDMNQKRTGAKFLQPYAHRCLFNLYPEPAEEIRKDMKKADLPLLVESYTPLQPGAPGGSLYIHHSRYLDVGGHDPNYCWGYGPEDAFFFHKLGLLEPIAYADEPAIDMIHLWHPTASVENPLYRNMDILIKGYFMNQGLSELKDYLEKKKAILLQYLKPYRRTQLLV